MRINLLYEIAPKAAPGWSEELARVMPYYGIDTVVRQTMFLAQCAHESKGFTTFIENLNYSTERLMEVWPSRFTSYGIANEYAHQPERLANFVYANRLGNGNESSGDGWLYRGRGCIQLTGRRNYRLAGEAIQYPLERYPGDAALPEMGARVACWLWSSYGLNELADAGRFDEITRRINGGQIGGKDREKWLAKVRVAFAIEETTQNDWRTA